MLSERAKHISPFIVMEVLEKAAEMERKGIDVVHLEVGEPDFDVPTCVSDAVGQAYTEGRTHYTHSLGDPELRDELVKKYAREYGVTFSSDQILVTSGSSPAILLVLGVLCDPGDEVILSDPGYACYPNFMQFLGIKAVKFRFTKKTDFNTGPKKYANGFQKKQKLLSLTVP
jgi:(5-formylfuran-3-yl)methyl phosphate transaminase